MKRFIVYLRVSTGKQERSGLGLEAQKADIDRFLPTNGTAVQEFIETESGKSHKNRPALLAALDACRKQRATLLIARLDRLARNVAFIASLMESGVEFVAVDMPHATKFTIHILAAVAEHERELISKRTKDALAAAKARGIKLGGPDPLAALAKANAAKHLRPPARHVMELMATLRDARTAYDRIAAELNSRDIRTPQGARWYASTVRAALLRTTVKEPEDAMAHALYEDVELARNDATALSSPLKAPEIPATPSSTPLIAGRRAIEEGAYMPTDIKQAERMLDLFMSVGATRFNVTLLDIHGRKTHYYPQRTPPSMRYNLSSWMAHAAKRRPCIAEDGTPVSAGENLIIRPVCTIPETAVTFVQLDDLKAEQLERVRPASFLIIETSPGNHQAWLAVSGFKGDTVDLCRRVRKAMGAGDHSATGSTRIAGAENFKPQYLPEPPMVSILHGVPGRVMTQEELRGLGLLAEPEQVVASPTRSFVHKPTSGHGRTWPDYGRCLAGAPMNSSGTGPDRSLADYTFAKFSAQRGWSIEEIAAELPNVSEKARERINNRDPGYVTKTAENGAAAAARGRQKSRA